MDSQGAYVRLVSKCSHPSLVENGAAEHPRGREQYESKLTLAICWNGSRCSIPHLILPTTSSTKKDRASMNRALEARPPLLVHRVVARAFALPRRLSIRNGETKWLLRRALERYCPLQSFRAP
jgi:asparagine synthase (glutamine-hydrolysing)